MALYVSNTTTHERLDIGMIAAESVWIAADSSRGKIAVASIYRPPRADVHQFSEELEVCITAARKNYENILLLGDFNATHSSWIPTNKTDSMGESLHCPLSLSHCFINFSTHIHRQLPSACLDLVISNISSEDLSVASFPPLGASHHALLSVATSSTKPNSSIMSVSQIAPHGNGPKTQSADYARRYLQQTLFQNCLTIDQSMGSGATGSTRSLAEQRCKTPPRLPNTQQRQS